jgi:hypothetical protein
LSAVAHGETAVVVREDRKAVHVEFLEPDALGISNSTA